MKLSQKFQKFIEFSLEYKLKRMVKKKSDTELLELYSQYSPEYFKPTSLHSHIYGAVAVYIVGEELKTRYPKSAQLNNWNYTQQLDLFNVIGGQNHGN